MPDRIEIRGVDTTTAFRRVGARYEKTTPEATGEYPDLLIALEADRAPLDDLGPPDPRAPTIVVRSAVLPVRIADPFLEMGRRVAVEAPQEDIAASLEVLLQSIFAKREFRDGQLEALLEVVAGRSCAVLLPTGAGKSLIYQLAGLALPGRTIVVDPIVALMEDQVRGLNQQGIDRVVAVSSHTRQLLGQGELLEFVSSGDALFVFLAPERLQQRRFRESLRALAQRAPINIAVVDEAHCVSEWGHDFRTSYLNLGRILREHLASGADDQGPPVLALTGTASRAVLRDVLIELEIDRADQQAVIQPRSFDRPELEYEIVAEHPSVVLGALTGVVATMPRRFNLPESTFFDARGTDTMSGIVFCPWINGEYGVVRAAEELGSALHMNVPFYAGGAPKGWHRDDWEAVRRENAEAFKANEAPLLVATKAFGMGIDKPNVRYIVHLGIPGSIEAYYQEVGRAGRDRERATCVLITTEYDEGRARRLLDDERDLESIRRENEAIRRRSGDDVTRMLFFLLNSFAGEEAELGVVESLLADFGDDLGKPGEYEVPMDRDGAVERGLHRLVILGVLEDYMVDWGGKKYEAQMAGCSPRTVLDHLVSYVRRSQPGQADVIASNLRDVESLTIADAVIRCAKRLIAFVYETVERSRRRSLREMWLAARESRSDPNGTFRRRILDYLSQGSIAPGLERLVDESRVDLADWTALLDEVWLEARAGDRTAATELRGATARLLGSYPDHPGLLIARGVSELYIPDGVLEELISSLRAASAASRSRYGIDREALQRTSQWLVARARESRRSGALTAVALGLDLDEVSQSGIELEDVDREAGLAVMDLAFQLERSRGLLNAITDELLTHPT
jgi:ATP-dependent DNA helicase RecQ